MWLWSSVLGLLLQGELLEACGVPTAGGSLGVEGSVLGGVGADIGGAAWRGWVGAGRLRPGAGELVDLGLEIALKPIRHAC